MYSFRSPFVNFERFTNGRLRNTPGAVKLRESSSRAGGFILVLKTFFVVHRQPGFNNLAAQRQDRAVKAATFATPPGAGGASGGEIGEAIIVERCPDEPRRLLRERVCLQQRQHLRRTFQQARQET